MITFGPEIAEAVLLNCRNNAAVIAEAVARAFGVECQVIDADVLDASTEVLSAQLASSGLIGVLKVGPSAALMTMPGGGLVPGWCAAPDAGGKSRLATLAQELAMLALPEGVVADDCKVEWADDLAAAVARGQLISGSGVSLSLSTVTGQHTTLSLIWPAANPAAVFVTSAPAPKGPEPVSRPARNSPRSTQAASLPAAPATIETLPGYSRSLLKIQVAVTVALASKKQPIGRIIELGPGAIIHFEKSCEEMLDLEIGGQTIAQGEPVKVGDRFGIRLTSLTPPHERFVPVVRGG